MSVRQKVASSLLRSGTMSPADAFLRVIGMTLTSGSVRHIIGLLMALSVQAGAQTTLSPMTAVRLTTKSGQVAARIVEADSMSLLVELPSGARRAIARADVISVERRGGTAMKGAKILGVTGLALGALTGLMLVEGLCETSDCNDDIPPAMLMVGAVFGGVGAASGAFLGHNTSWRPVDTNLQVHRLAPVLTCIGHPRIEAQFGNSGGMLSESHRQFNVGAVCGAGTVIGVDFARLGRASSFSAVERIDPAYGPVGTDYTTHETRSFRGGFIERPLTRGAVRFSAVALFGEYRTDSARTEYSYMKEFRPDTDWEGFRKAYAFRSTSNSTRAFGGGVGVKAALAIGPQLSIGFASRLHQVGSAQQRLESGVTLSFRP